jgi:hypothetical protein
VAEKIEEKKRRTEEPKKRRSLEDKRKAGRARGSGQ